ncbi:lipoprotein-anchoring transpeptidase ErfK/SrfK [Rhodoligotrophos appendicifer]
MSVFVDGRLQYRWPVSTARRGYRTPEGTFHPTRLERVWYSSRYENAPMPHAVFFHGGYAIHGTLEIRKLGQPVSHGCIRLHPSNAKAFFDLVVHYGAANTFIKITQ